MNATIYHNPACGTSRNTLALIRHAGVEPTVIEYLQEPPTRERLIALIAAAAASIALTPRCGRAPCAVCPLIVASMM